MINIIVFLKIGIKDNVTTLLVSLSTSDIMFLALITPSACSYIIIYFIPDWQWTIHRGLMEELLYWPAFTFYDFSSYISVWLGVTRCACVAMPLQFKSVFTKARSVKTALILFILAVSLRMPVLTMFRLEWMTDSHTNSSLLFLKRSNSDVIIRFNDILNRSCLPWMNFIIMIICVGVIKFKLYQASIVRKSHKAISTSDSIPERQDHQGKSSQDLRVIQSVVLICCIFIVSQLPFLAYSIGRRISPEFDIFGRLQNLFFICSAISRTCSYLNASVNIFVYYNYNSKYKSVFLSMLKLKS
ncbi:chemosensory receptor c [Plakobranchus ocellatus]|uniref:Chemosensory receptor c n=1 Tax=Plakobranchus ocellatus TaxID=259542 RepID=A0AAV4BZQ2_9GAST|nr:chemosensory receptor c [Plakobranchus ocellatus]